jgi:Type VII secretion system ESX-1, transport TM domain B
MQSRRDLFHAHRLMTSRAALALLRGEPDIPDQPFRRLNVAALSSVLVAVIVAGLIAVLAARRPSSSRVPPSSSTPAPAPPISSASTAGCAPR